MSDKNNYANILKKALQNIHYFHFLFYHIVVIFKFLQIKTVLPMGTIAIYHRESYFMRDDIHKKVQKLIM